MFVVHAFMANVGRGRLLDYSHRLLHMPLPLFLTIYITSEANNHNGCCDFLKEPQT